MALNCGASQNAVWGLYTGQRQIGQVEPEGITAVRGTQVPDPRSIYDNPTSGPSGPGLVNASALGRMWFLESAQAVAARTT